MIRIHNSLSDKVEPFEPLEAGKVKMYVCGPTVYWYAHIGNGRTLMFFDVVRRYFAYRGFEVNYVQNFTDVDDRIIAKAHEEGRAATAVAADYTQAFLDDMDALGAQRASSYPKATESIDAMIAHIQGLVDKQMAYAVGGDVYFRVQRFPRYGQLSGRTLDKLASQEQGTRVELEPGKEHAADFALWKAAKPGEPAWESPWGPGRPGWHIECSAMIRATLGDTIDLHAGGMDLKFPHHENEIAQSEALTDKPFVRYWLHANMLNFGSEKMSKSVGNIKTIRDVVATFGQQATRLFLLKNAHYRMELSFSEDGIRDTYRGFQRLRRTLSAWEGQLALAGDPDIQGLVVEAREGFTSAMDDDFNTPRAIAHFDETAKRLKRVAAGRPELVAGFGAVFDELARHAAVLGLDLHPEAEEAASLGDGLTEDLLALLISLRQESKAQKNWAMSDAIRNRLKELGIQLVDQKDGTTTWDVLPKVLA